MVTLVSSPEPADENLHQAWNNTGNAINTTKQQQQQPSNTSGPAPEDWQGPPSLFRTTNNSNSTAPLFTWVDNSSNGSSSGNMVTTSAAGGFDQQPRSALAPRNTDPATQQPAAGATSHFLSDTGNRSRGDSSDLGSLTDLIQPSRSFDLEGLEGAMPPPAAAGSSKPSSRAASTSSSNFLPRNPRDTHSPMRRTSARASAAASSSASYNRDAGSIRTETTSVSARSNAAVVVPSPHELEDDLFLFRERHHDPEAQEQALFEQRLCEDAYGVAVRKINSNGKSTLRYVKCVPNDLYNDDASAAARSVSSLVRGYVSSRRLKASASSSNQGESLIAPDSMPTSKMALLWGRKRSSNKLALDRFVCVRKGKTTERTKRNLHHSSRLLSLITDDVDHPSLDIEAPTKLDRDKFARAFAKFLQVPLEEDPEEAMYAAKQRQAGASVTVLPPPANGVPYVPLSGAAHSAPDMQAAAKRSAQNLLTDNSNTTPRVVMSAASPDVAEHLEIQFEEFPSSTVAAVGQDSAKSQEQQETAEAKSVPLLQVTDAEGGVADGSEKLNPQVLLSFPSSSNPASAAPEQQQVDMSAIKGGVEQGNKHKTEDGTAVSSLTGAGFDQEIVEEMHNALTELRAELEASRAEAARAVKVAEQAIQSAENSSSKDWNSTVTHKAAEAAALAQRRSAEAMAKLRLAEERLALEKKNAGFWRKQAEAAEEEAGVLQTRVAAAEVQKETIKEELESERHKQMALVESLKGRLASTDGNQRDELEAALERSRALEIELDVTRRDLKSKNEEEDVSSDAVELILTGKPSEDQLLKLQAEATALRQQFGLLQITTVEELKRLPVEAQEWAAQVSHALASSQAETTRLRSKLAVENATRRKLLHEVQDLRGVIRVYCRPRPAKSENSAKLLTFPSQETVLLHREKLPSCKESAPMSFEFDRILQSDVQQSDMYAELEELVLGVLDGYNICVIAYGPSGCGKTYSLLGDAKVSFDEETGEALAQIEDHGLQLMAMKELFAVSEHRNERYTDTFSLTLVEVRDERLCDLVAGTDIGDSRGQVIDFDDASSGRKGRDRRRANSDDGSSLSLSRPNSTSSRGKQTKLEIRTNHDGDTVVQGLVSVAVTSFEEVMQVWQESLSQRAIRVAEQGVDLAEYEASTHVVATLKVISRNIATGIASVGKIQFFDLAGADLEPREANSSSKPDKASRDSLFAGVGNNTDWKFVDKSLTTLTEVANARCQFLRSVPYRNSTITHLLRDSIDHDSRTLFLLCVSPDLEDAQETACALRMAARMKKINVGRATKHTLVSD